MSKFPRVPITGSQLASPFASQGGSLAASAAAQGLGVTNAQQSNSSPAASLSSPPSAFSPNLSLNFQNQQQLQQQQQQRWATSFQTRLANQQQQQQQQQPVSQFNPLFGGRGGDLDRLPFSPPRSGGAGGISGRNVTPAFTLAPPPQQQQQAATSGPFSPSPLPSTSFTASFLNSAGNGGGGSGGGGNQASFFSPSVFGKSSPSSFPSAADHTATDQATKSSTIGHAFASPSSSSSSASSPFASSSVSSPSSAPTSANVTGQYAASPTSEAARARKSEQLYFPFSFKDKRLRVRFGERYEGTMEFKMAVEQEATSVRRGLLEEPAMLDSSASFMLKSYPPDIEDTRPEVPRATLKAQLTDAEKNHELVQVYLDMEHAIINNRAIAHDDARNLIQSLRDTILGKNVTKGELALGKHNLIQPPDNGLPNSVLAALFA